ncbi:RCC1 domain-containing protein [Pedobacter sp.]|uniref:RCC1 domain-containing protein n=1 Tax=Pedobacter sp. TaxID=1411316 RepID=UPI003C5F90BE
MKNFKILPVLLLLLGFMSCKKDKSQHKDLNTVVKIFAGNLNSFFLKADGTLWATGANNFGQLGDGTTTNVTKAKKIMDNVEMVSAGAEHTLIVKNDKTLWTTGNNTFDQLGDGTTITAKTPQQIMADVGLLPQGLTIH